MFNLHLQKFKNIENQEQVEVGGTTIFEHFQEVNEIWDKYKCFRIREGKLEGFTTSKNGYKILYSHSNFKGELKSVNNTKEVSFTKYGKIVLVSFLGKECRKFKRKVKLN